MRVHVLPVNDTYEHEEAIWCPCKTELDGDVVVHNSWDGREKNEPPTQGAIASRGSK